MTTAVNSILVGDCIEQMQRLPAGLFHCCVTSPPYWNLRSYLPKGHADKAKEIGSEKTPDEFVATMVNVFRGVRRVLRDDGVCWINLGDSYASGEVGRHDARSNRAKEFGCVVMDGERETANGKSDLSGGNQLLMPHRVAMALQADGWILRSTVVWAKKSPMPESIAGVRWRQCRVKVKSTQHGARTTAFTGNALGAVRHSGNDKSGSLAKWSACPGCDKCRETGGLVLRHGKWRPTTAHEYVFQFAKSDRYFCDGDAVAEQAIGGTPGNKDMGKYEGYTRNDAMHRRQLGKVNGSLSLAVELRNPRSVWTLSSEPYKGAHFATFPTELARRCIASSTSSAGCCPECGAAYAPVVSSERVATRPGLDTKVGKAIDPYTAMGIEEQRLLEGNRDPQRHVAITRVTGYLPTCKCGVGHPEPCRVFDPFGGSGTVAQVAKHLGRDYVVCELNPEYIPLIEARIEVVPRWKRTQPAKRPIPTIPGQLDLF